MMISILALQAAAAAMGMRCDTVLQPIDQGAVSKLYVVCGSAGVWLGEADKVYSAKDAASGGIVVVSQLRGETRVRLVIPTKTAPQVEDVTRNLVRLNGGNANMPLRTEIDLSDFATNGTISLVRSAPVAGRVAGSQSVAARMDLRPLMTDGQN